MTAVSVGFPSLALSLLGIALLAKRPSIPSRLCVCSEKEKSALVGVGENYAKKRNEKPKGYLELQGRGSFDFPFGSFCLKSHVLLLHSVLSISFLSLYLPTC